MSDSREVALLGAGYGSRSLALLGLVGLTIVEQVAGQATINVRSASLSIEASRHSMSVALTSHRLEMLMSSDGLALQVYQSPIVLSFASASVEVSVTSGSISIEVTMPKFYPGGTPIIRVTCKTEAGVLTNPTTLDVTIYDSAGAVVQTYAIGALTLESTGVYKAPAFTFPAAGNYHVKAVATGAVADVEWQSCLVNSPPVVVV